MSDRAFAAGRAAAVLVACACFSGRAAPVAHAARGDRLPVGVAAQGAGASVALSEVGPAAAERYGLSERGREILRDQAQVLLLEHLARERKIMVSDQDVEDKIAEIDRRVRATSGTQGSFAAEAAARGIDPAELRRRLALDIVHERLVRADLGLSAGRVLTGDQKQVWLDQQLEGLEAVVPPWGDGVAARVGDVVVPARDVEAALLTQISAPDLRDLASLMLLERVLAARAGALVPPIGDLETAASVQHEVERRRAELAADPRYAAIPFEQLLGSQGMTLASYARDPGVRAGALAALLVARSHDDTSLRACYAAERDFYEARYGEALQLRLCFQNGTAEPNALIPRTPAEAERALAELARGIESDAGFAALCQGAANDDADSRRVQGDLGWVTISGGRLGRDLADAVFGALPAELPAGGQLLGPFRTSKGAALLWVRGRRASPPWSEMSQCVGRELKKRLMQEALPADQVRTWLDP